MANFGRAALRAHCEEQQKIETWLEQRVAALEGKQLFQVGLDRFHMYADGTVEVQVYLDDDVSPRTLTYTFDELIKDVTT